MRTLFSLVMAALIFCAPMAFAQDPLTIAPKQFKVREENDKVRVLEYTSKKGDKVGMHSHPSHVVYVIKAGKTKFTSPDGKTAEPKVKDGDVLLRDPVTHSQETLADTHVIVVELKK